MAFYKPVPGGGQIEDAEESDAMFEDAPHGLPALHIDGEWRKVRVKKGPQEGA